MIGLAPSLVAEAAFFRERLAECMKDAPLAYSRDLTGCVRYPTGRSRMLVMMVDDESHP